MSKKEKTVVPKLRFSQFRSSPEWSVKKLGSLIEPVENRAGTKKYTLMSVTSGVGLVTQIEKFGREIAGSAYKNYYVIKEKDFAYNKSATKQFPEGYISMLTNYEEVALPNSIFTCFRIVNGECEPRFFDHLFHNNYHGTWLRKYIEVGARAHGSLSVDNQHLWNMPIALPKLQEQQKIADCLSSLDELIDAEDKKLSALKLHKKGLMQKLFPAVSKTIPEWRFPEFGNNGNWKEKNILEFGQIIGGGTPSKNEKTYWNGNIPWISSADIMEDSIFSINKRRFITKEAISLSSTKLCPIETICIVSRVGVGKIALTDCELCTSQDFTNIINITEIPIFIAYLLSIKMLEASQQTQGTSIKGITIGEIKNIELCIPEISEQHKIADCLLSIDDFITEQSKKINRLKQHKIALLQSLFPSIKEVDV